MSENAEKIITTEEVAAAQAEQTSEVNQIKLDDGKMMSAGKKMISSEKLKTAGGDTMLTDTTPEELFDILEETIKRYHPSKDLSMVEKAFDIAYTAHKEQRRKSGEPYIVHPLSVAIILAQLQMDLETITAGILHDVVEDTVLTIDEMKALFGADVALLVDGVTKLTQLSLSSDKLEIQAENLRKMFLAMAKDIRVIIIKLADRLHNMRTLQYMRPEKQKEKAKETLEIYAPIADRLGISKIKIELDDLALMYLEPEVYADLVEKVGVKMNARGGFINQVMEEVRVEMEKKGIECKIDGRVKHYFSIYKKMVNQNKTLDQIYDIFAIRIRVNTKADCYAAVGIVSELYKSVQGRYKDYISVKKSNDYQSIHLTLIGNNGLPFEIQIRTHEMHRTAEYGIAAHWRYKEAQNGQTSAEKEAEKLNWLRQILEWQKDMSDNKEFLSSIKTDLDVFSDTVYCFTPEGDVKNLPSGATTIDFAYSIHSAVGNHMVGAKVNDTLVPIDYQIQTGDRIQIMTSQNQKGPSRDWLKMVKTAQARNKINQWFRSQNKEENIEKGKEALATYCKAKNIDLSKIQRPEFEEICCRKHGFQNWNALLAAIGHGGVKEGTIVNRLQEEYFRKYPKEAINDEKVLATIQEKEKEKEKKQDRESFKKKSGIVVQGIDDMAVRFSKCCNPLPGDEIVGFITRGRGISIHRTDCINVLEMSEEDHARLIEAEWSQNTNTLESYPAEIAIIAYNRVGLSVDVSIVFAEANIDITSMNIRLNKKKEICTLLIGFDTHGVDEFNKIVNKLNSVTGVIKIDRSAG